MLNFLQIIENNLLSLTQENAVDLHSVGKSQNIPSDRQGKTQNMSKT
jgi:hypothetical protein